MASNTGPSPASRPGREIRPASASLRVRHSGVKLSRHFSHFDISISLGHNQTIKKPESFSSFSCDLLIA